MVERFAQAPSLQRWELSVPRQCCCPATVTQRRNETELHHGAESVLPRPRSRSDGREVDGTRKRALVDCSVCSHSLRSKSTRNKKSIRHARAISSIHRIPRPSFSISSEHSHAQAFTKATWSISVAHIGGSKMYVDERNCMGGDDHLTGLDTMAV